MRRPNLIVAGVRKAGTTSLYHYLRQHPQVCACRVKEASYFIPLKYGREPAPLEEYLELFSHCRDEPYLMDVSPGYFAGGAAIADGIASTLDDARVVVILRNPIETFGSNFNFLRSRLRLPKQTSMATYLDRCEELHRRGEDRLYENRDYNSLHAGLYAEHLPGWVAAFGDRFRVLFFDDLRADPRSTIKELCRWLGIDVEPADGFDYALENRTRLYRIGWLQRVGLTVNRRAKPLFYRFRLVKKGLRAAYYAVNADPQGNLPMPPTVRQRLEAFYAEPNRQLAEELRELGYERLPAWLDGAAQPQDPADAAA